MERRRQKVFYRGHPAVFVNLKQIVIFSHTQSGILFRNDYMFRSKQIIIRPPLQILYNKV